MVYTHKQCIEQWSSDYQIGKAVSAGKLFKIEKGVYADTPVASSLAIVSAKYPTAIITMDTAFYYHGLTDVIPDICCIATPKSSRRLRNPRIRQFFVRDDIWETGVTTMERRDASFRIYDKERMLIELIRFRYKMPFDYYKEIIGNYRNIIYDMDIERLQEYSMIFPKSKIIRESLEMEVL